MSLLAADQIPLRVSGETECAERDTLIELHMLANVAGLTDHHTCPVVDEEVLADLGTGMNVDARFFMRPFGHHAGDERNAQHTEFVSQSIDGHGVQAGIAEDHFIDTLAGRIAVISRLHVGGQHTAQIGNPLEKRDGNRLPFGFVIVAARRAGVQATDAGLVLERPADLHGQLIVQAVDQVSGVIGHIAAVQPHSAPIPGIEDFLQVFQDFDHRFVLRQWAMAQVIDAADFAVGGDDSVRQIGQLFFESEIGGHGRAPVCSKTDSNSARKRPLLPTKKTLDCREGK